MKDGEWRFVEDTEGSGRCLIWLLSGTGKSRNSQFPGRDSNATHLEWNCKAFHASLLDNISVLYSGFQSIFFIRSCSSVLLFVSGYVDNYM